MPYANLGAGVATRFDEMRVKRERTVVTHFNACLAEFSSFEWRWYATVLCKAETPPSPNRILEKPGLGDFPSQSRAGTRLKMQCL
jgi:hypothetical protein